MSESEASGAWQFLSTGYTPLDIVVEVVIVLLGVFFGLVADSYRQGYLDRNQRVESLEMLADGLSSTSRFVRHKMELHQHLVRDASQAVEAYPDGRAWKDSLGTLTYPANRIPSSYLEALQNSDAFGGLGSEVRMRVVAIQNRIQDIRRTEERILDLLYQVDYGVYLVPGERASKERRLDTMDALIQIMTPLGGVIDSERGVLRQINKLASAVEGKGVGVKELPKEVPDRKWSKR